MFLTNPSPICVLDEVDAPLDDANVERFCDLLDEMARRTDTRFVVITHNPITMARMDRLFGVTMAERGVSQLVSVDLRPQAVAKRSGGDWLTRERAAILSGSDASGHARCRTESATTWSTPGQIPADESMLIEVRQSLAHSPHLTPERGNYGARGFRGRPGRSGLRAARVAMTADGRAGRARTGSGASDESISRQARTSGRALERSGTGAEPQRRAGVARRSDPTGARARPSPVGEFVAGIIAGGASAGRSTMSSGRRPGD